MRIQRKTEVPVFKREYGELKLLCGRKDHLRSPQADMKILTVRPGLATSHHLHLERDSLFHILQGTILLRSAKACSEVSLEAGDTILIEPGEDHTLSNLGTLDATVLEVESPPHSSSDRIPFGVIPQPIEIGQRQSGRFWTSDAKVKVKICGVKNLDTALECARLQVDAVGLHAVGPKGLATTLRDSSWSSVIPAEMSVFVLTDSTDPIVLYELMRRTRCDTVQMQGRHPEQDCAMAAQTIRGCGRRAVLTLSAEFGTSREQLLARIAAAQLVVDAVLIDASEYGGTGHQHDWDLTESLREQVHVPLIIAGGLNPSNCVQAIKKMRPYGIDVESGVEAQYLLEDRSRLTAKRFDAIKALVEATRNAS